MENKEPKSGTPAAASNNGSTHTSGQQQPGAAPEQKESTTYRDMKPKLQLAISDMLSTVLKLSAISIDASENTAKDIAEAQYYVQDFAQTVLYLIDDGMLDALDRMNWSAEYELSCLRREHEETLQQLADAKKKFSRAAAVYANLWDLTFPHMSKEARAYHAAYKEKQNSGTQL